MTEKEQDTEKPQTRTEVKAEVKRLLDKLAKQDAQRHGGAPSRAPKARLLDARAIEEKDPEHHYCYVNTDDAGNVQTHVDEGYEAVPDQECRDAGVRDQVGETRLMRCSREHFEAEKERAIELNESRLRAHKTEMIEAVSAVARQMGVPVERLLIDED